MPLNLPGIRIVKNALYTDPVYNMKVEADTLPDPCCLAPDLVRNGTKRVMYRDLTMHGKHVGLWFERQRYKCKACDRTLYQPLPGISDTHRMTERLVQYIEKNATERTFASLSKEVGLNETTVRNIFRAYAERELAKVKPVTPKWLGLDELYLLRQFRGIVTNVKDRTILDLLPNRSKKAVIAYLSRIPDKETIELVNIDMWQPYREAAQLVLPHAQIIVDKFHITRMANEALERVRKEHRKSLPTRQRLALKDDRWILLTSPKKLSANRLMILETWTKNYPLLGAAYAAKEGYAKVWEAPTKEEAMAVYDEWEATLPESIAPAFKDLTTAMKNWREEIFAYFEHKSTNAYTEALNGLAKIMNRLGRGYSFEVIRAKLLLNYRTQKIREKGRFKRSFPSGDVAGFHHINPEERAGLEYLGIDISTLTKELRALPDPRKSTLESA